MANFVRDPNSPWNNLVELVPIDALGNARVPAIAWETADGSTYKMRGTIAFDRFKDFAKTRFFVDGCVIKDDDENRDITESPTRITQEILLPSKTLWRTQSIKVRGRNSYGRSIGFEWKVDRDADPRSLTGMEVIVPMNEEVDEGKRLELAVEWAKKAVDANIAWMRLGNYEFSLDEE